MRPNKTLLSEGHLFKNGRLIHKGASDTTEGKADTGPVLTELWGVDGSDNSRSLGRGLII